MNSRWFLQDLLKSFASECRHRLLNFWLSTLWFISPSGANREVSITVLPRHLIWTAWSRRLRAALRASTGFLKVRWISMFIGNLFDYQYYNLHTESIPTISYAVGDRDTLTSIAARFDTTPSELKTLNRLGSSFIYSGQTLQVPDKSAQNDDERSCSESNDSEKNSNNGGSSSDIHQKEERGECR